MDGSDHNIQGIFKNTLQSFEIYNQEGIDAFELFMETDHWCFVTLPQDAAHSSKTNEFRDTKYGYVYYRLTVM